MSRILFLTVSLVELAIGQRCSGTIPSDLAPGKEVHRHFSQRDPDPRLGTYHRQYHVILPTGYTGHAQVPMLFYFHGWGDDYTCIDENCSLAKYGSSHGFVVVKPKGKADGAPSSWNLGTANRTDTCNKSDVDKYNYSSCFDTGVTSICNCGTCYDDFRFVADLTASLIHELCVDPHNIYASGASFGALFNYYAAPVLAKQGGMRFRAILPWYGAFYRHTQNIPDRSAATSVFHFHGLLDTEVPAAGGESADGYLYIPVNDTLHAYAAAYSCDAGPTILSTPFDGRGTLVGCIEWKGCKDGLRIVRCNWREQHGFWPDYAEEMMWWFMGSLVSRKMTGTPGLQLLDRGNQAVLV